MILKRTCKILLILVAIVIALSVAFVVFFATRTSQSHLRVEQPHGAIGVMPVDGRPMFLQITPELRFKFDTGADLSFITEKDLAILQKMGYKVEEYFSPVRGRDGAGITRYALKRYRTSLPFYTYAVEKDSAGNVTGHTVDPSSINVVSGVDFVLAHTDYSVLGMDFLEKFKIEYCPCDKLLGFYYDMPSGYNDVVELDVPMSLGQLLTPSNRYYLNVQVNEESRKHYLDTGIRRAFIKRSDEDTVKVRHFLIPDTVVSAFGPHPAMVDTAAWITIGKREGPAAVFYYTNSEEDCAINPLNMHVTDVLFDFPERKLYFGANH